MPYQMISFSQKTCFFDSITSFLHNGQHASITSDSQSKCDASEINSDRTDVHGDNAKYSNTDIAKKCSNSQSEFYKVGYVYLTDDINKIPASLRSMMEFAKLTAKHSDEEDDGNAACAKSTKASDDRDKDQKAQNKTQFTDSFGEALNKKPRLSSYAFIDNPSLLIQNSEISHNGCGMTTANCEERYAVIILGVFSGLECATTGQIEATAAAITTELNARGVREANILLDITDSSHIAQIASGIKLRNYLFNKYFYAKKQANKLSLNKIEIFVENLLEVQKNYSSLDKIDDAVHMVRNLINEPPNVLYPESFMLRCKELIRYGLNIIVLERDELHKLGMNGLLGVAQGSAHLPYVVILEWRGKSMPDGFHAGNYESGMPKTFASNLDNEDCKDTSSQIDAQFAFVGKGVTFDSGGLNIKTGNHMSDMKYDMGGAATVVGIMQAIADNKLPIDAVGIIGLVENMPSGAAQRPGDVIRSMSGQTIEIDNTDAEGRIVLADILHYVQQVYKPSTVIDFATLTGAIVVALGEYCAGLFSNSDALANAIYQAGLRASEAVWQLPMSARYDKQINSMIADVRNTSSSGRGGSSITAAQFLRRFVQKGTEWAHLDIAGVAWASSANNDDVFGQGATGFGVRLIMEYLTDKLR